MIYSKNMIINEINKFIDIDMAFLEYDNDIVSFVNEIDIPIRQFNMNKEGDDIIFNINFGSNMVSKENSFKKLDLEYLNDEIKIKLNQVDKALRSNEDLNIFFIDKTSNFNLNALKFKKFSICCILNKDFNLDFDFKLLTNKADDKLLFKVNDKIITIKNIPFCSLQHLHNMTYGQRPDIILCENYSELNNEQREYIYSLQSKKLIARLDKLKLIDTKMVN